MQLGYHLHLLPGGDLEVILGKLIWVRAALLSLRVAGFRVAVFLHHPTPALWQRCSSTTEQARNERNRREDDEPEEEDLRDPRRPAATPP